MGWRGQRKSTPEKRKFGSAVGLFDNAVKTELAFAVGAENRPFVGHLRGGVDLNVLAATVAGKDLFLTAGEEEGKKRERCDQSNEFFHNSSSFFVI